MYVGQYHETDATIWPEWSSTVRATVGVWILLLCSPQDQACIHCRLEKEAGPSSANRTKDAEVLVYNRVPKCGSSTLLQLAKILGSCLYLLGNCEKKLNIYFRKEAQVFREIIKKLQRVRNILSVNHFQ